MEQVPTCSVLRDADDALFRERGEVSVDGGQPDLSAPGSQ
jgi:hypothetical protein